MRKDKPYQDIIKEYSLAELHGVKKRINKEAHPDRYALVLYEIAKRKASHELDTKEMPENIRGSLKVHHKESTGNILIFTALVSFMLKEQYLSQLPASIIGVIFLFVVGVYYRTATYAEIKNNHLILSSLLGFKKTYDLKELNRISIENDKLFLITYGGKVDSEIKKRDANPKEWKAFVAFLSDIGLVK